jgi:hypothetical protein
MASAVSPVDDLQQQMRQVRREMKADVQEIVENAQVLTDWRHYVRTYPWLCVGAAAGIGFFLVPSRRIVLQPDPAALAEVLREHPLTVQAPTQKTSLLRMAAGMVMPMIVQGASAFLQGQLDQFLRAQHNGAQHQPAPQRHTNA